MNSLTYLTSEVFSSIPRELLPDLQRMISANEASRPTALDFTGYYDWPFVIALSYLFCNHWMCNSFLCIWLSCLRLALKSLVLNHE